MSKCVDELRDQLAELDGSLNVAIGDGFIYALDDDEYVVWTMPLPCVGGVEL